MPLLSLGGGFPPLNTPLATALCRKLQLELLRHFYRYVHGAVLRVIVHWD